MTHRDHRNDWESVPQERAPHERGWSDVLEILAECGFDGLAQALEILFNEAMKLERSAVLEAQPYERSERRRGYANGFKPKRLETRVGRLALAVPQTRGVAFYPTALERGARSERALKVAVAEMYLQGVSTRKVTAVMEELCGREVTSSQVSRAVQSLDEELTVWRTRPLGEITYLLLDARYEKVRVGGSVVSCALLVAVGITPDGQRTILGLSVSLSEAEVHWRELLASLQERGLHGVRLVVSDDHAGLGAGARGASSRRALATLPVPSGQEHARLLAAKPLAERSQCRLACGVQRGQPRGGRAVARLDGEEVCCTCAQARGLAGEERAGGADGVRLPAGTSPTSPHQQRSGASEPRDQTPHPRGVAVPQRSFPAPPGHRGADGS
jgi:hypothetical protein